VDRGSLLAIPLSNELDDRSLLIDRHQSEEEWALQVGEAAATLKSEAAKQGGQVLGITLTPYVSGQPFRQQALRHLLAGLALDPAIWCATSSEIADCR